MKDHLRACCVHLSANLLDALRSIEHGHAGIAFVLDDEDRLLGTVTDGDIRRRLLHEPDLHLPVATLLRKNFTAVGPDAGRAEVLDLMQTGRFNQIPIVDAQNRLMGVHLLHEIIGVQEHQNWVVIMAGGKGVRLRPLTENIPKPMIKVAGRPILERLVLHLVGCGFRRIFLSVNYLAEKIEEHFGTGEKFGCQIEYLHERQEMGTAGALALLPQPPSSSVLVLNGDLVTEVNFGDVLSFHENGAYAATVAAKVHTYEFPYGCLSLDEDGLTLRGLEEKPIIQRLVNAGIYVLSPEAIAMVPAHKFLMTELLDQLLQKNLPVGAYPMNEEWLDVGQREQLQRANGR